MARATADKLAYRLSLWVSTHWLETAGGLTVVGTVLGVLCGYLSSDFWSALGTFETCYGVLLAIGIFTWTLAGFSTREADRKRTAAEAFGLAVGQRSFTHAELDDWHLEELARVFKVQPQQVENELLLWLVEAPGKQGPREALVVTQRLWFLRLVGRGRGGKQTIDLSTGAGLG